MKRVGALIRLFDGGDGGPQLDHLTRHRTRKYEQTVPVQTDDGGRGSQNVRVDRATACCLIGLGDDGGTNMDG